MQKHWKYLKYVLRHKWFVFVACQRNSVSLWQALTHDMSKFLPDEWTPYARYFYGDKPRPMWELSAGIWQFTRREDSVEGRQANFDAAWLKHIHRNPHHWQHWLLQQDDGELKALPMPQKYINEMLADWEGAGRSIHGRVEVAEWYEKNKHKQIMHEDTRSMVDFLIKTRYVDMLRIGRSLGFE